MTTVWELDFYSRPIVDEQQRKIWELLVCNPERTFEYIKSCAGSQANARWLSEALQEALQEWQLQEPEAAPPEKIRFFRRPLQNMILRACDEVGMPAQLSRRTFGLHQWLQQRHQEVYPNHPGFQPLGTPPLQLEEKTPQRLPDPLLGNTWRFATLAAEAFADLDQWSIDFGESLPLQRLNIAPETPIPGVIVFSSRAMPLAAWMSGLEMAFLKMETDSAQGVPQLLLETGGNDRWIMATLKDSHLQAAAHQFERTKRQAQQVHFLAVQTEPQAETFAGFWLLQEINIT